MQGKFDTVIPADSTKRLAQLLERAGAQVAVVAINAGHELTRNDLETAHAWLSEEQVDNAVVSNPPDHKAA
jgi:predicted esterase